MPQESLEYIAGEAGVEALRNWIAEAKGIAPAAVFRTKVRCIHSTQHVGVGVSGCWLSMSASPH